MLRSHHRPRWIVFLTVGAWLIGAAPAFAYIDAGTTSAVFGAVVAAAMAVSMTIKIYWRRLRKFFSRSEHAPDESPVRESQET